ncbi:MAG TPA: diguanylate cyclase [Thermoanaerobaculia bacterium]|nr:diguanylate cyclase [Thermoanaerobaculia bacterium]
MKKLPRIGGAANKPRSSHVCHHSGTTATTPFLYDGATRTFSASAGLAAIAPGDTPDDVKRRADEALYRAKREGRGRWVVA